MVKSASVVKGYQRFGLDWKAAEAPSQKAANSALMPVPRRWCTTAVAGSDLLPTAQRARVKALYSRSSVHFGEPVPVRMQLQVGPVRGRKPGHS